MRAELFKNRISQKVSKGQRRFLILFGILCMGKCDTMKVDYFPIFFYRFLKFPITYLIAPVLRRRFIAE